MAVYENSFVIIFLSVPEYYFYRSRWRSDFGFNQRVTISIINDHDRSSLVDPLTHVCCQKPENDGNPSAEASGYDVIQRYAMSLYWLGERAYIIIFFCKT